MAIPDIYQKLLDGIPGFDLTTSPDVLLKFADMLECGLPHMGPCDANKAIMTIGAIRAHLAGGVNAEIPTLAQIMLSLASANQIC